MTRAAFPYMRIADDSIRADAWMLKHGDQIQEAPPYLDGWDYNTTLELTRDVRLDVARARNAAGLATDVPLRIAVTAFSTATWSRNCVYRRDLDGEEAELTIAVRLEGDELGGNLHLATAIVLARATASQSPFVAHLPGSVIWSDRHEIRLQGDAPLFPISVIDFERAGYPSGAGWHLDIGVDLDAPVHNSLRLYLNHADSAVVTAFANAAAPRPDDQAIVRAIFADVARIMIEHALNQEELQSDTRWGEDTLGFALRNLLLHFFPADSDLRAVRAHRVDHPADFSSELLGKLGVFR